MTPRERFEANLPLVDRLLASIATRNGTYGDDAEDFASWARLRLIENDYAVLSKFQGRAKFSTYLNTVIHNLFRDYRIHKWGKWRPSAAAKRIGPDAVLLETLVLRDGYEGSMAIRVMRENFGIETAPNELEDILGQLLGRQPRRRELGSEALEGLGHLDGTESRVRNREKETIAATAETSLAAALARLGAEDRLVLKLRFEEGWTLAHVARSLHLDQKGLYRRMNQVMSQLRAQLESSGVTRDEMERLIRWAELDLTIDLGDSAHRFSPDAQV